jgi:predicted DNA-binding transcriptional regulator YafY
MRRLSLGLVWQFGFVTWQHCPEKRWGGTMVYSDALTKASRLVELQFLFWSRPGRAVSSREVAHALGIAPRTARKYVAELSLTGRLPVVHERLGWRLVEGARLEVLPVRFQLEEAAALFLAARLLAEEADEPNRAVHDALTRLARVMPVELREVFGRLADRTPAADGRFVSVFRAFAYGWALRRVLELTYEPRTHPGAVLRCEFSPYLLEPVAASRALYAIGRADPPGELRVLKIERVHSATLTDRTFAPPPLDQLLDRLDRAWGVWLSDEEPVHVRLSFGAAVAQRVRETRWHPSQQLTARDDGSVELTLTVASVVELLPWVVGWGRHCKVLAPADLAAAIAAEHRAAAASYDAEPPTRRGGP